MRKGQLVLLTFLLFSLAPPLKAGEPIKVQKTATYIIPLRIVFTGYNPEVVNTTLISANVQKSYQFSYGNHTVNFTFSIEYFFANTTYNEALKSHVIANSVNGTETTSKLNITALQYQKATGTKMSIFLPQSGRAIDAKAVESWFEANPYADNPSACYWFYVMNFTEFDSADHSLEHWYNTTEIDLEANNPRDFWRLEWDNALNPDVKFPYAAFTSQSRIFFIDPSAFQWYLTWARIWWGLSVSGPKYVYYYEDLDQFQATRDLNSSTGKTDLAYYLAGWIEDPLKNLLAPSLYTSLSIFYAKSLSLQALILNNASQSGYTNEAMQWILNKTLVEVAVEDLAPFIDVKVEASFLNLTDYPELEAVFDNAVVYQQNGWTYYDGGEVFDELYNLRESYFNFTSADVVINGYVLLESNMSMLYAGGEYTGLGGGGQILIMKSVERYFRQDGVARKSGLGAVFIHEAGHNLGFPHTFTTGRTHVGDFSFDVMGYYPLSYFFTQLRKDCFRRLVDAYRILCLEDLLNEDMIIYSGKPPVEAIDAKFNETYAKIDESKRLYGELQYLEAFEKIVEAENLERELREAILAYIAGAVVIKPDGSIEPPTAPIVSSDNVTYTFTGNLNNTLFIQKDNIVVDGAGYAILGNKTGAGVDLTNRRNVTVKNLEIREFSYGIYLENATNNYIYHNSFVNNANAAHVNGLANSWDNGYPSGGNYWSDYSGADLYRGSLQNEVNSDGIGDTPKALDENNTDRYPLMKRYSGQHDIGLSGTVSKTVVAQGYNITLTVNVKMVNYGTQTETFNFSLQILGTFHEETIELTARNSTTRTTLWNTTGFAKGYYAIIAYATPVLGENDAADNNFTVNIYISVPGDVDGNHAVNMIDLYNVAVVFGALRSSPKYVANCDIDDNGIINMLDLYIAAVHFGQTDP
ncbi:MAG: NosD domain-containing protein [Candidatus Bathyarchaeia archaeon]